MNKLNGFGSIKIIAQKWVKIPVIILVQCNKIQHAHMYLHTDQGKYFWNVSFIHIKSQICIMDRPWQTDGILLIMI